MGDRPVFTPLNYPYSGLASGTIANILNAAIDLAGLVGLGYTAKSFRPTGATVAVQGRGKPDTARATGRWKNRECFEEHYIHAKPEATMSGVILLS